MAILIDSYLLGGSQTASTFGAAEWRSTTFKATANYTIYSVKNAVWRNGAVDPGAVTIHIRAAGADVPNHRPTGSDLVAATVISDGTVFPTSTVSPSTLATAYEVVLTTPVDVVNGNFYAIIYSCVNAGTMYMSRESNVNGYPDGGYRTSADSGVTWAGTSVVSNAFAVYAAETEEAATFSVDGTSAISFTATDELGTGSTADRSINLIAYTYSSDTTYTLEFGERYLRVFYGDAVLLDGDSNEVWLETPYLTEHLYQLQFKQIGDVMRITHPAYQIRTLRRTSATSFDLQVIPFETGPFLTRHDIDSDDGVTLTSSVSGVLNGTVSYSTGHTGYASDFGHNYIRDNWWDDIASHALGADTDYCGGGSKSGTTNAAWINYKITLPETITLTTLELTYICMSYGQGNAVTDITHTKRGLSVYLSADPTTPVVVIDPAVGDADFPATTYVSKPGTLIGHAQSTTITPAVPIADVIKIEIFLYSYTGASGSIACALFNAITNSGGNGISDRTGTLTASDSLFETGHIGTLFQLVHPRANTYSSGASTGIVTNDELCAPISVKGEFRFTTTGDWSGTVTLQRRENSLSADDWETFRSYTSGDPPDSNANYPYIEDNYNVEYRVLVTTLTSKSKITGTITVVDSMQTGIVRIDSLDGTYPETIANITMITPVASTDATKRWAEGTWSGVRGYPLSCCFIEERCCYLGLNLQTSGATLLKVWLSRSRDYDNFDAGINADDSFEITIPTTEAPAWIEAMDNLTVATEGGTWFIRSNKIDSPLVPVPSPIVRSQSGYICDPIRPVDAGKAMLYVSGRQVRELGYDNESKGQDADLTVLAEHFTESPIIGVTIQRNPQQVLWFWHEDFTASILAYEKEQNHYGWAHIDVGGEVQSICVTPGELADDIWVAAKRTINSADVIYIEKIKPQFINADTVLADLFYVDCGKTFTSGTATTTVTGATHLIGETVAILADGIVQTSKVVNGSGEITLDTAASKVQYGLAYTYKCQPNRIVTQTPRGTTLGSIMTFNDFTVSFLNTMNAKYGAIDSDLRPFDWTDTKYVNNSEVTGLFSGDIDGIRDGAFNSECPIIISGNDPLPCCLRAIVPKIIVTGA